MGRPEYGGAERVFWVVDNGSSHRGQASVRRLQKAYANAILVHTPVHASWLNQVEVYFSLLQRKLLRPNHFGSLDELQQAILDFIARYNQTATPLKWSYTVEKLEQKLGNHL